MTASFRYMLMNMGRSAIEAITLPRGEGVATKIVTASAEAT